MHTHLQWQIDADWKLCVHFLKNTDSAKRLDINLFMIVTVGNSKVIYIILGLFCLAPSFPNNHKYYKLSIQTKNQTIDPDPPTVCKTAHLHRVVGLAAADVSVVGHVVGLGRRQVEHKRLLLHSRRTSRHCWHTTQDELTITLCIPFKKVKRSFILQGKVRLLKSPLSIVKTLWHK